MEFDFCIRPIQEKDFDAFRALFCNSECLCNIGRETQQDDLVRFGEEYVKDAMQNGDLRSFQELCAVFRTPPDLSELWIMVAVGQSEEKIIGSIALEFKDAAVAELRRMCVSHEFRRHGLGKRLVLHCLAFAMERGYRRVFLTTPVVNTAAIAMYTKAGFVRDDSDLEYSKPEIGIKNLKIARLTCEL